MFCALCFDKAFATSDEGHRHVASECPERLNLKTHHSFYVDEGRAEGESEGGGLLWTMHAHKMLKSRAAAALRSRDFPDGCRRAVEEEVEKLTETAVL